MSILDEDANNRYISLGRELGFDAAISEALTFHLSMVVAFVSEYPWLWNYGDGRGGAIFFELEDQFESMGFKRVLPVEHSATSKPKRKPLKKADIIAAMQRIGGRCAACGDEDNLEVDHILPVARGGTNNADNLQMLCKPCNMSKGAKTMEEWQGEAA